MEMTVFDLVEKLLKCKQDAKVHVLAHNQYYDFTLSFGGGCDDGKNEYTDVSFYVEELNQSERRT